MNEWILIVAFISPGGNFIDKVPVTMPTKIACEKAIKTLPKKGEHPMGVQYRGVCVTQAHWTGTEPMKTVPLDWRRQTMKQYLDPDFILQFLWFIVLQPAIFFVSMAVFVQAIVQSIWG